MTRAFQAVVVAVCAWGGLALDASAQQLEDDDGSRMRHFYEALARAEAKQPGAVVRVAHYGDSLTESDAITGRVRSLLQRQFGDGGAGFLFLGKTSPHYRNHAAARRTRGWRVTTITSKTASDRLYGLGGATFEGSRGAFATFSTAKPPRHGKPKRGGPAAGVSTFELYYLEQPKGGTMELVIDGQLSASIDTAADSVRSAFHAATLGPGEHEVTVRVTRGRVRGFGAVLERSGPGVAYDNLGILSGSAKALAKIAPEHLGEQLARRAPDLIVVHVGANDAGDVHPSAKSMAGYQALYTGVLASLRQAAPAASCLVMSPTDSARPQGSAASKPTIPLLVAAQRRAALASGCAFWDVFEWMGGRGSARKWRKDGRFYQDLMHPTHKGAAKLAEGLAEVVLAGYRGRRLHAATALKGK